MGDNVSITAGTGTTVAFDEVADGTLGTVKVQMVKVMDGTLDSTNKMSISAGGAVKVDNSGVTQPVSAASLPLPSGASTAAKQPALGTAGAASSDVISIQGIASMTKLLVTPDANHTVNVNQLASTAIDVNSGTKSAGTQRIVIATDQPALTNALKVDGSAVTQPVSISGNQAVNVAQINGVTPLMGNGIAGTGSQRVTICSDSTGQVTLATGAATIGALVANQSVNLAQLAGNTISSGIGATGTGTVRTVIANDVGRTLVSKGGTVASSGNNTLVTAGTNKLKVFAFSLTIISTTAVTCIFQSGTGGTELWRVTLQAPGSVSTGANLSVTPPAYLFTTAAATLLNLNLSAAVTVHYSIAYFDEA